MFYISFSRLFKWSPLYYDDIANIISFLFLNNAFHYRNRLESNSEHWNALLLSLRELTEWVIRKDTELSTLGLGPVRGDAASLQKQLVSNFILSLYFWLFCTKSAMHGCDTKWMTLSLIWKHRRENNVIGF